MRLLENGDLEIESGNLVYRLVLFEASRITRVKQSILKQSFGERVFEFDEYGNLYS